MTSLMPPWGQGVGILVSCIVLKLILIAGFIVNFIFVFYTVSHVEVRRQDMKLKEINNKKRIIISFQTAAAEAGC